MEISNRCVKWLVRREVSESKLLQKIGFGLNHELGGGRRRRRAQVRDKVRDRKIRFVPNAGNHRDIGNGNGARHHFLIKSPEILQ